MIDKTILEALKSISVLNREMGGVLSSIKWIQYILGSQSALLIAILGFSMRAKYWAKRNGNNRILRNNGK